MKNIFLILIAVMFSIPAMSNVTDSCKLDRVMGTSYFQAKTNCEVILNGQANNIQYAGNNLWYCDCTHGCSNPTPHCSVQRTMGVDYFQAKTNCELILKGRASNFQYSGNNLWYCTCTYNCH